MSPPPASHSKPRSKPGSDARRADAADLLLATAPLVNRWTERLLAQREPPLTLGQYSVLSAVADGQLTAAELARRTGVSGSAVSQLLAGLVSAGWVSRRTASDRRRQELGLTSAGRALLADVKQALAAQLSGLLDDVPPPELDALARALPFAHAALAGTAPPRRPPRPPAPVPPGPRHGPPPALGREPPGREH